MLMTIHRIHACVDEESNKILKGGSNMNRLPSKLDCHTSMDVLDLNNLYHGWSKEVVSTDDNSQDMHCYHFEESPKITLPCFGEESW